MKAYFEYISENEKSYLRFRFNMFILIFGLIALYIAYLTGKSGLGAYSKTSGVVQNLTMGIIQVKPQSKYDFRDFVEKDVVDILINNVNFIVRDKYENGKVITLKQIRRNDSIVVYFHIIDGYNEIVEISKDGKMLLNLKGYEKKWEFLNYLFPILIIGFVSLFIWVYRMRKNNINKKVIY